MNHRGRAGNDLHRLVTSPEGSDLRQVGTAAQKAPMPVAQHGEIQRSVEVGVEGDHQVRRSGLLRSRTPLLPLPAEALPDGGPHRVAIQNLPLDGGGVDRLVGQELDPKFLPFLVIEMPRRPQRPFRREAEIGLERRDLRFVPSEPGPIRPLPDPAHER